ncbi:MAG TPA: D-alanyl-D-alanine carboxypeptidase family protein [Chloroflexota bacterium]|nr:D-alanyl-D-alanine carboxypeptidase family protein [Chloroflexota bacterium]
MGYLRTASLLLVSLVSLCLVGFGPPAIAGTDASSSRVTASQLDEARGTVPAIKASAAAVVDGDTGALVWGKNAHDALPPASMTKMMTALVTLQHGDLTRVVTSGEDASTMLDDSVMGLHIGEQLSLRDLLFGLLIPSGDDAALVIAQAVGGSQANFVSLMNAEGNTLGLTDTHFVNPHGLDAPGHLSSPYDEIVIARAAMQYPLFREIVDTKHIVIHGKWVYDLTNTNQLLGKRKGVIGIKTGTTDLALHAITVAEEINGHLLYVTVMHTPDYVPDETALLDYFEAHDSWVTLSLPDGPLYTGAGYSLAAPAPTRYLPNWQATDLTTRVNLTPDAPLRATDNPDLPPQNDGTITYSAAGQPIARLPLQKGSRAAP